MIIVTVRHTKAAQGNPALLERLRQPMALGIEAARRVKERVALQGQPATTARPYQADKPKGAYVVSEPYAAKVGAGQTRFRGSAAFHAAAGVRSGSFRVSGAMWQGLQVRNSGADAVVIDFEGSSLGARRQSTKTAGGRQRSRPVQIRNQLKAGTVFRFSRVNVVQPTPAEQEALAAGVAYWAQKAIDRVLGGVPVQFTSTADPVLLSRLQSRPVV